VARGFGPDMPVADDATEEGRERNRRVEVWLR
jgi:outer membrane protein OmpA-like peptidoglycan-associated protein